MPHATEELVNGDSASSKTFSHITSYPVVSDGIKTFESNPYGKKAIEVVDGTYERFAKPVEPYLETPYSYAKPYVNKVDELGDRTLSSIDSHFPIVKEKTDTIFEKAKSTAFWPYTYLTSTWQDEYTKTANHNNRGAGITTIPLAVVSLELRVASDFFHYVADTLRPAYEDGKSHANDAIGYAQKKASEYEKYGKDKYEELSGEAKKKADHAKHETDKTAHQAKDTAHKKTEEVKSKAQK